VIVASMVGLSVVPAEAAPPAAPVPFVVAIDAGHGGSPDNSHPDRLFDPGSVSGNGLMEKDVTLDLARRVQHRLQSDQVKVVMTRDRDSFVSIPDRMSAAAKAGANVFVSIHLNFFQDPRVGGTVVLYPRDSDKAFAQVMSDAVARRLDHFQVSSGGLMLRDNLWGHAPMPAVTVEAAYLTNRNEAELLATDNFKEAIAAGVANGVEVQLPGIPLRKTEILKYRADSARAAAAHRAAPLELPSLPILPHLPLLQVVVAGAAVYLLVRFRRQTIPALAFAIALGSVVQARAAGRDRIPRTRRGVRRRRSRAPLWTGARY
jgi:N-acetylmuramoyl-L-alanine amidase